MKIICVLQNSWGGKTSPIFKPNPFNKSAKTLRKICGENVMHFCNTTALSATSANGKFKIDRAHFEALIPRFSNYDIILVCGKQAEEAHSMYVEEIAAISKPVVITMHPAARTLTNKLLERVRQYISTVKLNEYSYAKQTDWNG